MSKKTEPQKALLRFEPEAYLIKVGDRYNVYLSHAQGPLAHGETESEAWENALMKYFDIHPLLKPNPKP
jgi:hypothetical protein